MSQNVTTDPSVLEPDQSHSPAQEPTLNSEADDSNLSTPPQASGFSVDTYAKRLMDELFEEVEGMLERGAKSPTEPAKPEFISLQSLAIPKMVLPSLLASRAQLPEDTDLDRDLDSLVLMPSSDDSTRQGSSNKSVDRVLLVAACASLLATAGLWFAFQNRWEQATPPDGHDEIADANSAANDPFLPYMQRSLAAIERKAEANQQVASGSSAIDPNAPNLPSVSVPGSTVPGVPPQVSTGVPERVYIPVYQPPQASALPGVAVNPLPTVAVAPNSVAPQTTAANSARGTVPNISSASASHVLVGLLELEGDRSAALFEVNGTTQRIRIGEAVGSSGWTLVSVSNGEAIVRRNGEVRSIFVGQSF